MRPVVIMLLAATATLAGCQALIAPDPDPCQCQRSAADHAVAIGPGATRPTPPTLVEIGPHAPECTIDQADEHPMVAGRSYVIAWAFGNDRYRAYGLKEALLAKGCDVAVGRHAGHGMYFVRSRKGYDWGSATGRSRLSEIVSRLEEAMKQVQAERPSILQTTVHNISPYVFEAKRP